MSVEKLFVIIVVEVSVLVALAAGIEFFGAVGLMVNGWNLCRVRRF